MGRSNENLETGARWGASGPSLPVPGGGCLAIDGRCPGRGHGAIRRLRGRRQVPLPDLDVGPSLAAGRRASEFSVWACFNRCGKPGRAGSCAGRSGWAFVGAPALQGVTAQWSLRRRSRCGFDAGRPPRCGAFPRASASPLVQTQAQTQTPPEMNLQQQIGGQSLHSDSARMSPPQRLVLMRLRLPTGRARRPAPAGSAGRIRSFRVCGAARGRSRAHSLFERVRQAPAAASAGPVVGCCLLARWPGRGSGANPGSLRRRGG